MTERRYGRDLVHEAFGTCRACGAFVDRRARHCPQCGLSGPLSAWRQARAKYTTWSELGAWVGGLSGLWLGAVLGSLLSTAWQLPVWSTVLAWLAVPAAALAGGLIGWAIRSGQGMLQGALVGGALAALAGRPLKAWLAASAGGLVGGAIAVVAGVALGRTRLAQWAAARFDGHLPHTPLQVLHGLQAHIRELEQSAERMAQLGVRVETGLAAPERSAVLATLQVAQEATERQRARLEVEVWRAQVAKWQNQLQPALAVWRKLDDRYADIEHSRVERAANQLHGWVEAWQTRDEANTERGAHVLTHAKRLLQACGQLRQALLVRQALALAANSPGPAEAFAATGIVHDAQAQFDLLRGRQDFGEYLSSAADLRDEAQRLRAEQEAIAEVERLLVKKN